MWASLLATKQRLKHFNLPLTMISITSCVVSFFQGHPAHIYREVTFNWFSNFDFATNIDSTCLFTKYENSAQCWSVLKLSDLCRQSFWGSFYKSRRAVPNRVSFDQFYLVRRSATLIKPTWHLVRLSRTISQRPLDLIDPIRLKKPNFSHASAWRGATYKAELASFLKVQWNLDCH